MSIFPETEGSFAIIERTETNEDGVSEDAPMQNEGIAFGVILIHQVLSNDLICFETRIQRVRLERKKSKKIIVDRLRQKDR